jgi:hypothetical protein
MITPPSEDNIINKILHDQVSVYKVIVDADGQSIIHFSKVYSVFPKNVPRDVFSSLNKDGGLSISVNFNGAFVEDMDPLIISDFNDLVSGFTSGRDEAPLYDIANMRMDRNWAYMPYISKRTVYSNHGSKSKYILKWRK